MRRITLRPGRTLSCRRTWYTSDRALQEPIRGVPNAAFRPEAIQGASPRYRFFVLSARGSPTRRIMSHTLTHRLWTSYNIHIIARHTATGGGRGSGRQLEWYGGGQRGAGSTVTNVGTDDEEGDSRDGAAPEWASVAADRVGVLVSGPCDNRAESTGARIQINIGLCVDPPADDAVMCVTVGDEIEAVSGKGDDEVDDRGTDGGGTDETLDEAWTDDQELPVDDEAGGADTVVVGGGGDTIVVGGDDAIVVGGGDTIVVVVAAADDDDGAVDRDGNGNRKRDMGGTMELKEFVGGGGLLLGFCPICEKSRNGVCLAKFEARCLAWWMCGSPGRGQSLNEWLG
ncbi:hypothetical protein GGX14DRAFT_546435 [Mycena pura]|uniref:Uncharacterized protein n=1 Tax=Mycena pura TaxID=153505 RepID=A0AAD6UY22_9AGAR|nr:hypothetical protein GGX14DRAFT_546435 [Mycena pura]